MDRLRSYLVLMFLAVLPMLSYQAEDIHQAVQEGNLSLVKEIIENQPKSIFLEGPDGLTPLHHAARLGHIEIIDILVSKGADVNILSSNRETPLHSAALTGKRDAAAWLIEKGASVDVGNKAGYTPLILAVMRGHGDFAGLLLENGADPNLKNIYSHTPMVMAASMGRIDLMELLCENGAAIKEKDLKLLHYVIINRQKETADYLISKGLEIPITGEEGRIFLHLAVQNGLTGLARLMIDKGADIHLPSPEGGTLLHSAAYGGDSQFLHFLLGEGFDINEKDSYDMTPLHFAAFHGLDDIISRLVEGGAEINAENILGETPLDMALSQKKDKTSELPNSLGATKGYGKKSRGLDRNLAPTISWRTGADLPSYVRNLGSAAANGKVYAVGGYGTGVSVLRSNYEYDPRKNNWAPRAYMPTPRSNLAVVSLNEKVYVFGGNTGDDRNEVYDPITDQWQSLAPMPTPRFHLNGSAAAVHDRIYVQGGAEEWFVTSSKNEVYVPESDSWGKKAPMPTPRQSPVTVVCGEKIYAIGGHGSYVPIFLKIPVVEAYDPEADSWERKTDLPESGFVVGAVEFGEKILVLIQTGQGKEERSKIYVFDPDADRWSTPVDVPRAVRLAGMTCMDNTLFVVGGGNSQDLFLSILIGEIQNWSRYP